MNSSRSDNYFYLLVAILAAGVSAIAITPQSLWIDEGGAAFMAMAPDLKTWWYRLLMQQDANLELVFQNFYLWAWEKIFGHSEIALRVSNLPWFVGGVMALVYGIGGPRSRQVCLLIVTLINAHLWYYLSEARPYIVLFSFSCMSVACLIRASESSSEAVQSGLWFRLFCLGIVGTCATSSIGVPWAIGSLAALFYLIGGRAFALTLRRFYITSIVTLLALSGVGLYYLWTIHAGLQAQSGGRTGITNALFVCYELLGLAGLGPGRIDLRESGPKLLLPYLPILVVSAIPLLLLFRAAWSAIATRYLLRPSVIAIAIIAPLPILFFAAVIVQMRLLGRHFMPVLPYVLVFEAIGLQALWKKSRTMHVGSVALLLLLLTSALEIRLCSRHKRDDYRSAAHLADIASRSGNKVWWVADENTGSYYGIDFQSVVALRDTPSRILSELPDPDVALYSKPDIFDNTGAIEASLRSHGLRPQPCCQAFTVWRK